MSTATRHNHEIDYKLYGEELQFVEIELDPQETAIAESGCYFFILFLIPSPPPFLPATR